MYIKNSVSTCKKIEVRAFSRGRQIFKFGYLRKEG